jgi:hypothetical protein
MGRSSGLGFRAFRHAYNALIEQVSDGSANEVQFDPDAPGAMRPQITAMAGPNRDGIARV